VMTTNEGAAMVSRNSVGFTHQDHTSDGMEALKRLFTPEFRNRLDAIIQFAPLDERTLSSVVDKFIAQLESQLSQKKVDLIVDEAARSWIGKKGYDPQMGARPMARVLQEHIKRPLSEAILFGDLAKGGVVHVSVVDNELYLDYSEHKQHAEC